MSILRLPSNVIIGFEFWLCCLVVQAGLLKGTMVSNMTSAYRGEGIISLYWNFLPFLLKGIPYDVAELFSYSQLTEHQLSLPALKHCPEAFRDCAIGKALVIAVKPSYILDPLLIPILTETCISSAQGKTLRMKL